jgi:hypothetical protein
MGQAEDRLRTAVRDVVGDSLRDLWVFGEHRTRALYLRDDVESALDDHDPEPYIDNERYGYITRKTYENLTYASYEYTVRGFDSFETFRTFVGEVGVLVSYDADADIDARHLHTVLSDAESEIRAALERVDTTGSTDAA